MGDRALVLRGVAVSLFFTALWASAVRADSTVNFDFQGPSDVTHVGDDGVLSSSGGNYWNSVTPAGPPVTIVNEFGQSTGYSLSLESPANAVTTSTNTNNLQDSALDTGILVSNLPFGYYDVAAYIDSHGYVGFQYGGENNLSVGVNTGTLPGDDGADYALKERVLPYEVTPGNFGLGFGLGGSLDGHLTGLQIRPTQASQSLNSSGTYADWSYNAAASDAPGINDQSDSGSDAHPLSAGMIVNVPAGPHNRPAVKIDGSAGLNPFGGGSAGARSEISRLNPVGSNGGTADGRAGFYSQLVTNGPNTAIDVDLHLHIDGYMDIVGDIDPAINIADFAQARVGVIAKIRSNFRPAIDLFVGEIFFAGADDTLTATGHASALTLGDEMTYTEFLDSSDQYNGGRLQLLIDRDFEDIMMTIPGEIIELQFEIATGASFGSGSGPGSALFVLSDFLNTVTGAISTDTEGATFTPMVPEPALGFAGFVALAMTRRRRVAA